VSDWLFFLSYARADRDGDAHDAIGRFYEDLVDEVGRRTGLSRDRIGFFDREKIEQGERWPDRLADALKTCRAFVPVLSPTFFSSDWCGREWGIFRARLLEFAAAGRPPPLIQPLLLVPRHTLDPLPAAVEEDVGDIQVGTAQFPEIYLEEGLHYIAKLAQHADDYEQLVTRFAQALVAGLEQGRLEPADDIPQIKQAPNVFAREGAALRAGATAETPVPVGRFAQFVYVAARRSEVQSLRDDVTRYGDEGGLDWKPYRPDLDGEIALIAQEIASKARLRYDGRTADAALVARLTDEDERRKIVVVIADLWTLRLDAYHRVMRELDERDLPNCVVLVPWNLDDAETAASREALSTALEYTFANKAAVKDPQTFVDGIASEEQLRNELAKALDAVRLRLIRIEEVRRRAESDRVIVKPIVAGPGGGEG
jgi:FxsC-like protein